RTGAPTTPPHRAPRPPRRQQPATWRRAPKAPGPGTRAPGRRRLAPLNRRAQTPFRSRITLRERRNGTTPTPVKRSANPAATRPAPGTATLQRRFLLQHLVETNDARSEDH